MNESILSLSKRMIKSCNIFERAKCVFQFGTRTLLYTSRLIVGTVFVSVLIYSHQSALALEGDVLTGEENSATPNVANTPIMSIRSAQLAIDEGENAEFHLISTGHQELQDALVINVRVENIAGNFIIEDTIQVDFTFDGNDFPSDQNRISFFVSTLENDWAELDGVVRAKVLSGTGYEVADSRDASPNFRNSAVVRIRNDELEIPKLSLSTLRKSVNLGETANVYLTATSENFVWAALKFTYRNTDGSEVEFTRPVHIRDIRISSNFAIWHEPIMRWTPELNENSGELSVEYSLTVEILPGESLVGTNHEYGNMYIIDRFGRSVTITVRSEDLPSVEDSEEVEPIPEISIRKEKTYVNEGESLQFILTASVAPKTDLPVNVKIEEYGEYLLNDELTRTVTIRRNEYTAIEQILTVNDDWDEPNGNIRATLLSGIGYGISEQDSAVIFVRDNDDEPYILVGHSIHPRTIIEGETIEFNIHTYERSTMDLTINLSIQKTGEFLADSSISRMTMILESGQREKVLSLQTVDDEIDEVFGTVTINILEGDGYQESGDSETVIIVDNDPLDNFNFDLPMEDNYTIDAISGELVKKPEVSLTLLQQSVIEGEVVKALISSSYAISTDLYVNLRAYKNSLTKRNPGLRDSQSGFDWYPTIVIPAGETSAIHTIETVDDDVHGTETEYGLTVDDFQSSQYITNFFASGSVAGYFRVIDNDPSPLVSINSITNTVVEGDKLTFQISADRASANDVTINLNVSESSGSFLDYSGPRQIMLKAFEKVKYFSVQTVANDNDEDEAIATVEIDPGLGYGVKIGENTASVRVVDDERILVESDSSGGINASDGETVPEISIYTTDEIVHEERGSYARFNLLSKKHADTQEAIRVNVKVENVYGDFLEQERTMRFYFRYSNSSATDHHYNSYSIRLRNNHTAEPDGLIRLTVLEGTGYTVAERLSPTGKPSDFVEITVLNDDWEMAELSLSSSSETVRIGETANIYISSTSPSNVTAALKYTYTLNDGRIWSFERPIRITGSRTDPANTPVLIKSWTPIEDNLQDSLVGEQSITISILGGYTLNNSRHAQNNFYRINGESKSVTVTVVTDDSDSIPEISISAVKDSVIEGETAQFSLNSSVTLESDLAVLVHLEESGDYLTSESGIRTIKLKEGATFEIFEILTNDDDVHEQDGEINAVLYGGTKYSASTANNSSIKINDNDSMPVISFKYDEITIVEGNSASLQITANGRISRHDLVINYQLEETNGVYFVKSSRMEAYLRAGELETDFEPHLTDNNTIDEGGKVTVTIVAGTGYTVGDSPRNQAVINIVDNDEPPKPKLELLGELSQHSLYDARHTGYSYSDVTREGKNAIFHIVGRGIRSTQSDFMVNLLVKNEFGNFIKDEGRIKYNFSVNKGVPYKNNYGHVNTLSLPTINNFEVEPDGIVRVVLLKGEGYQLINNLPFMSQTKRIVDDDKEIIEQGSIDHDVSLFNMIIRRVDNWKLVTGKFGNGKYEATIQLNIKSITSADVDVSVLIETIGFEGGYTSEIRTFTRREGKFYNYFENIPIEGHILTNAFATIRASVIPSAEYSIRKKSHVVTIGKNTFYGGNNNHFDDFVEVQDEEGANEIITEQPDLPDITINGGGSQNDNRLIIIEEGQKIVVNLEADRELTSPLDIKLRVRQLIKQPYHRVNVPGMDLTPVEDPSRSINDGYFIARIEAGETSVSYSFNIDDNLLDKYDSPISFEIRNGLGYSYGTGGNPVSVDYWVRDNDGPKVSISGDGAITEGENAEFTISIVNPIGRFNYEVFHVDIRVDDGESNFLDRESAYVKRVKINFGERTKKFSMPTVADTGNNNDGMITAEILEGWESSLISPEYYLEDPESSQASVLVLNRDEPVVSISADYDSVIEGGSTEFTIIASEITDSDLEVAVFVRGYHNLDNDFYDSDRSVTIPAGRNSKSFTVTIDDDDLHDTQARITASIGAGQGYTVTDSSSQMDATVIVVDNDEPPSVSVSTITATVTEGETIWFLISASSSSASQKSVNVTVSESESSFLEDEMTSQATIWAYYNAVFLRVRTVDNRTNDLDGEITIQVNAGEGYSVAAEGNSAKATVVDNDEPVPVMSVSSEDDTVTEGENVSFNISADRAVRQVLTIDVRVTQVGDFISGDAPTEVEFGISSTTIDSAISQTFVVETDDDVLVEDDGSITVEVVDGDGYDVAPATNNSATVTITDNDKVMETPIISVSAATSNITEGDTGWFVFTSEEELQGDIQIKVMVVMNGVSSLETLAMDKDESSVMLSVATMDDELYGSEKTVVATLVEEQGYEINDTGKSASITVENNEPAPEISVEAITASVTEGTQVWFLFRATHASTNTQTINISVIENIGSYLEGEKPKTLTILPFYRTSIESLRTDDDDITEEDGSITVTIEEGDNYKVSTVRGTASVVILDNDYSKITLSIVGLVDSIDEGGIAFFNITASETYGSNLTIGVSVEQTGEFISGQAPTHTTLYANTRIATLLVRTEDDEDYEVDGSITAKIFADDKYSVATSPANSASIEVNDNDELLRPMISVAAVADSVAEGNTAEFTVISSHSFNSDLTIQLLLNLSGDFFGDRTTGSDTVTIPDGETFKAFNVATQDDNIEESDGSVTLLVTSDTNSPISYQVDSENYSSTVNITDDDDTTVISISAVATPVEENTATDSETGTESTTKAEFTIISTKTLLAALTINLDVQETGSMVEGTLPESVELPPGQSSIVLQLDIEDDDVNEPESRITVNLEAGTRYSIAESPDNSAFVDVQDNDQIMLTPRIYNNYISFRDEDNNGPWRDYHWGLYEGLPAIVYFQNDSGKTAGRDLTINFEVADSESKLIGPLPTSTVLKANESRANSFPIPSACNETRESSSRIRVTLKEGDGYVFEESRKTAEGYLLDIEYGSQGLNTCPGPRKISIVAVDNEIGEGETVQFNVTADAHERHDYFVNYKITNEVGNFMEDADVKVHTVRIAVGTKSANSQVFRIVDNGDLDSQTGVIAATIVAGDGYVAGATSIARVNVLDNDGGDSGDLTNPVASIVADSSEIEEGDNATFTVSLNTDTTLELSISVSWTVEGNFLTPGSRSLSISTGKSVSLDLGATLENAIPESDGSVSATLGVGTGYQVNSTSRTASITILDDDTTPEPLRSASLHREVLPNLLGGTSERSVDAVTSRVELAFNESGQTKFELHGNSEINDLIKLGGRMANENGMELSDLFAGSSFTLPLLPDRNTGTTTTLWGTGFNRNVSDNGDDVSINWEGESFTGHLGVDTRFGEGLLAGAAVMGAESSVKFNHEDSEGDLGGLYRVRTTSMQPYLAWASKDLNTQLRGSVSYGLGEVEIDYDHYYPETAKSRLYSASVGGSDLLYSSDRLFGGGVSELTVNAEAWTASQVIKGNEQSIVGAIIDTRTLRIMAESSLRKSFDTGSSFNPTVLIGTRWDGGDNNTGLGVEMIGRADYQNPIGLGVSGVSRLLISNGTSGHEEGFKGKLNYDPGGDGLGIYTIFSPVWGELSDDGIQQLWDEGVAETDDSTPTSRGVSMETEIGYGFGILDYNAVVTPYFRSWLNEGGQNKYGIGSRFTNGSGISLEFEGGHETLLDGNLNRKLRLEGSMEW